MRFAAALIALTVLAGCSGGGDGALQAGPGQDMIDCAPAGAAAFGKVCTAELAEDDGQQLIIVRNPGGSFHRFRIVDDGRGLEAADGSQQLALAYADGKMSVAIGGDRYILPASVKGNHAAE